MKTTKLLGNLPQFLLAKVKENLIFVKKITIMFLTISIIVPCITVYADSDIEESIPKRRNRRNC